MNLKDPAEVKRVVEACAKGDRKVQGAIYKTLYSPLLKVCYRYTDRPEDAKDLFQEGFLKVFDKIEKFNFKGSLEGWIKRIMVNHCIDHYRRNKNKFAMSETLLSASDIADDEAILGEVNELNGKQILSLIQRLSPMYRTVFSMYVLDGYSHAEIAEELNISEGTSKSNLSKAKRNLKMMILELRKNEQEV